jgi:hypothetical protein
MTDRVGVLRHRFRAEILLFPFADPVETGEGVQVARRV